MKKFPALALALVSFSIQAEVRVINFDDAVPSHYAGGQPENCYLVCNWDSGGLRFQPNYPTGAYKIEEPGNAFLDASRSESGAFLTIAATEQSNIKSFAILSFDVFLRSDGPRPVRVNDIENVPLGEWVTINLADPEFTERFSLFAGCGCGDGMIMHLDNIVVETVPRAPELACKKFAPANLDRKVGLNSKSEINLKARLSDGGKQLVDDRGVGTPPVLQVWFYDGFSPVQNVTDKGASDIGFRFIGSDWRASLDTRPHFSMGTYTVAMVSGDPDEYFVDPDCSTKFVIDDFLPPERVTSPPVPACTDPATLLAFDSPDNFCANITLDNSITWSNGGGEHVFLNSSSSDDYIDFATDTYIESFQMTGRPYEGGPHRIFGTIDIIAMDSAQSVVWSTTVDLSDYANWGNWLTVNVNTGNIRTLRFVAPGVRMFPSIDNMIITADPPFRCAGFDIPANDEWYRHDRKGSLVLKAKLLGEAGEVAGDASLPAPPVIQLLHYDGSGPAVDATPGKSEPRFAGTRWRYKLGKRHYREEGKYTVKLLSGDPGNYWVYPECSLDFVVNK